MNEELAYLAGVLDSDGFITIRKHYANKSFPQSYTFSECVGVGQASPEAVKVFAKRWGGNVRKRGHKGGENWRPIYYWVTTNRQAADCIRDLRPWLRIKVRQADLVLKLRTSKSQPRTKTLAAAVIAERESDFRLIRSLNDRRSRA